jgi:hypothetical protein
MIKTMNIQKKTFGVDLFRKFSFFGFILLCVTGLLLASCASAPEYPVYPQPTTKILPFSYEDTFKSALAVLKRDERLELHTIDKAGRFLAWEKTTGFILFRHRTILDIELKPEGPDATKVTMKLAAEDYETGGLTREAGWYPSSMVDTTLGEDIMGLIEKEAANSSS